MDFNTIKEVLKFPDDVDEDTAWGDAIGQVTLGDYVGEDNLAEFKETYGFGDDITADTLFWKDVRQTVDEKSRQQRIESEKLKKNQIRTRILTVLNQQKHLPKQKAQMQQKLLMLNKF